MKVFRLASNPFSHTSAWMVDWTLAQREQGASRPNDRAARTQQSSACQAETFEAVKARVGVEVGKAQLIHGAVERDERRRRRLPINAWSSMSGVVKPTVAASITAGLVGLFFSDSVRLVPASQVFARAGSA